MSVCVDYPVRRRQVTLEWERLTAHIEADPESKAKLGCADTSSASMLVAACLEAATILLQSNI